MSTTTSRKPLQDISNKVHLVKTSQASLMKNKTKEMFPVKQVNNTKSSRMLDIRASKYDEAPIGDEGGFDSPASIGSLEEEFGELSDLREFYDEVSSDINEKVVRSLEKEKEKNTRLELQSERDRAKIEELQSENKQLVKTIDQIKQKPVKIEKPEVDFNGQVKQLNDKISKLERKVEIETQQKEKLSNLLKSKEQALSKIKEENDKATKGPIEEKCSRKLQDQIKIKEEKIDRMSKEIEKEKNTKQEYENLIQGLQEVSDNLRTKLSASNEEIETSNKLIEILDAKLKIANDRCKDLDVRLKKGEEKREEESSELLALREEMSHLCDSVLKEKQESERKTQQLNQIQAAKEKFESEYTRTSSKLKEKEEENEELKRVVDSLEEQIEQMGHDIDESAKELEDIEENFRKKLEDAENTISEKDQVIQAMQEKEERTMDQLKELDVFVERTKRKIDKEKEKTKESEERANAEYEKALQMIERNNSLMRKLDAVTRANHALEDEVKEKEDLLLRFKNYIEDTESKLHQKENECDQTVSKLNSTYEELQKEKAKSERSWKELEETVKMLHQIQAEKEVLEKKSSHSKEVLEMKMNNKISMLEKKCDYLKRLHEMNGSAENEQIKEMQNYIDKLTKENEKSSETVSQLEINLSHKDSEISVLQEKVRQLEDLLHNQNQLHAANLKPNDLKKRLMAVEKSMDEIIIELSIEGITVSQLNPREKAVVILEKFTEVKKECQSLTSIKDQYSAEVQRLKAAKDNSEKQTIALKDALTNDVTERSEECIIDLTDSCSYLYNTLTNVIEKREFEESEGTPVSPELLDELLESVLSIQVNMKKVSHHMNQVDALQKVIESQNSFNKDFVSLCGELENRVRSLMEERDTLLTAQFQLKDKEKGISVGVKKKLDKLMYKSILVQTSPMQCTDVEIQTEDRRVDCSVEEQPNVAEKERNDAHIEREHESLKGKYQKLLATCHKYKKLMLKFTQLHAKERTNTRQSIKMNEVNNQSNESLHEEQEENEDDTHQDQYEENEDEEEQEDYHEHVPVIHASLHHPLSFDKENTTPKSTRHNQSNGDSRDNSPSNVSVSSVRSVSTTLSGTSERSSLSIPSKFRKSQAQAPKDFNRPNSYLNSHMSVRNRLK